MAAKKHTTPAFQLELSFTEPEEWRPVVGYEGLYEVSNLGRVKSIARLLQVLNRWGNFNNRARTERLLRADYRKKLRPDGRKHYPRVTLYKDLERHRCTVHSLVLEAFVGARPPGYEGNHLDGDTGNNMLTNLEWCTPKENVAHAFQTGLNPLALRMGEHGRGENNLNAKLTAEDVRGIRACLAQGMSQSQIGRKFGVTQSAVWAIHHKRMWKYLPDDN